MVYRVVITTDASKDLNAAAAYIRRDSPSAARRWNAQIRSTIATLSRNPERCLLAPEAEIFAEPIRHLLFGHGNRGTYRVIFVIIDNNVIVLHVRHGSMLPLSPQE